MKKYIGVKMIQAKPMNLGDYNKYRGWQMPADEDPAKDGFLVRYEDGYESWSPLTVFDGAYRLINGMTFGLAVEALKQNKRVCRAGWNGKGMWLRIVVPGGDGKEFDMGMQNLPYLEMKTADNKLVPWLASQTDVLAEDWQVFNA